MSTVGTAGAAGDGQEKSAVGPAARPSVDQIETALAQARDLDAWWEDVEAGKATVERFEIFPASPGMEPTWGFFGEAPVQGGTVSVMGDVGDYFFDRPRVPGTARKRAAQWMLEQVEEFALRYWLRTEAWVRPEPYPELGHSSPPRYLKNLSWCQLPELELAGMGNEQRDYKLSGDGRVGTFPKGDRAAIIDLRDLESTYEWVTVARRLFDFDVKVGGVGSAAPSLVVPLGSTQHLVLNADLTVNRRDPESGTLGVFGVGFGLVKDPARSLFAVGPDRIQPGLELQYLRVLESGEVRARSVTIMQRPQKILNLSMDPIDWGFRAAEFLTLGASTRFTTPVEKALDGLPARGMGFDPVFGSIRLLNVLTGNRAANELCISKERIERDILIKHSMAIRQALLGSRQTWLQVPDWLDRAAIPEWVAQGETS